MTGVLNIVATTPILWPVLAFCLVFIGFVLVGLTKGSKTAVPYRCRGPLLTAAELRFYRLLPRVLDTNIVVCPQVRIADVLTVEPGLAEDDRRAAFNRIARKHFDFVLCDAKQMRPQVAIELDDRSHQRRERRHRDQMVNRAAQAAGMPLVRIAVKRWYELDDIRTALAPYLTPTQAGKPPADAA